MYCSSSGLVFLGECSGDELDAHFREVKLHAYTHFTTTDPQRLRDRLARVKQLGHALADRELSIQLRSVSMPIVDRTGRTLAALLLLGPAELDSLHKLEATLPMLTAAARKLEAML